MPQMTIYAAVGSCSPVISRTLESINFDEIKIGYLTSFFYIDEWNQSGLEKVVPHSKVMLDSGAYSAWNSGKSVDINRLIEETKTGRWKESVALDVIGDVKASCANALEMKRQGSEAYPVFHYGEPFDYLKIYCENFDKVGLSCRFGEPTTLSLKWLDQCFARAYPHKFHSFGWIAKEVLLRFPFHSGDSSSWMIGPMKYSIFSGIGKTYNRKVGKWLNLTSELERLNERQNIVSHKWEKELERWTTSPVTLATKRTLPSPALT